MWKWLDKRISLASIFNRPLIPRGKASWLYLPGFLTFSLILFELLTGCLLAFSYHPVPALRGQHVWLQQLHSIGAQFLIVIFLVYLLRNLLTGSYRKPRELNWLTLVFLFLLVWLSYSLGVMLSNDPSAEKNFVVFFSFLAQIPVIGESFAALTTEKAMTPAIAQKIFVMHAVILGMLIGLFTVFFWWLLGRAKVVQQRD